MNGTGLPNVVAVDLVDGNVLVSFEDGRRALYSAQLLLETMVSAESESAEKSDD